MKTSRRKRLRNKGIKSHNYLHYNYRNQNPYDHYTYVREYLSKLNHKGGSGIGFSRTGLVHVDYCPNETKLRLVVVNITLFFMYLIYKIKGGFKNVQRTKHNNHHSKGGRPRR